MCDFIFCLTMSDANDKQLNTSVAEEVSAATQGGDFDEEKLNVLREMAQSGVMYGHRKTKTNPRFKPFIYLTRNGMEIIDLSKTLDLTMEAADFLKQKKSEGKTILLVATQPAAWEAVDFLAQKYNFPFIRNKWIGGLLTNFKVIYQRLEYYRKLKEDLEKGALDKYTKKEKSVISKNIGRLGKMFLGLDNLTKMPDVIFLVDLAIKGHKTALREACLNEIPVVAMLDSDDNPELVDYPIPANDHSKMSIKWIINKIDEQLTTNINDQR